jgi:hypothetical protein
VLSADRIQALKADAQAKRPVAIVVLGGGMEALAPEYGVSSLRATSLERLRYGIWLGRETGLPVAFSGGVGWAQLDAKPEAWRPLLSASRGKTVTLLYSSHDVIHNSAVALREYLTKHQRRAETHENLH